MNVMTEFDQVSTEWLSGVLHEPVISFDITTSDSNWAKHAAITANLKSGTTRKLWLKVCLDVKSGRSEVDYYTRDYINLQDAPLIKCYDAQYTEGVGYHLLFDDLSEDYHDRKVVPPTLEHGLAIAEAVSKMHAHYWESGNPKPETEWETYFSELRPCVPILESATGIKFEDRILAHHQQLAKRSSNPIGQTLLHGDINPTNVLTRKGADSPVYFLDRQPLDGVTPYGVALYDLAYSIVLWWPHELWKQHEEQIVRCWYKALNQPSYPWDLAWQDWVLSVEQCLYVPLSYCSTEELANETTGLWKWQLGNLLGVSIP